MATSTKLTDDAVRAIADRILWDRWRGAGFDHAEVSSEDDVYGEPAMSVTAVLRSGTPVLPARMFDDAVLAMRDAIRAEGEQRYVYLHLRQPDEMEAEDDDADVS